jgi:hypothetical protein
MDAALNMYRRTNPTGPVDMAKLVRCSVRVVAQRDRQVIYRIRLIQELRDIINGGGWGGLNIHLEERVGENRRFAPRQTASPLKAS